MDAMSESWMIFLFGTLLAVIGSGAIYYMHLVKDTMGKIAQELSRLALLLEGQKTLVAEQTRRIEVLEREQRELHDRCLRHLARKGMD